MMAATAPPLPPNVRVGHGTVIVGEHSFRRFFATRDPALEIGEGCTLDSVHFALGPDAHVRIGDYCYFSSAMLLCEEEIRIGSYVVIGFNTSIADTDFHPIAPAERILDKIATSPIGKAAGQARRPFVKKPVVIEDDV